MKGIKRESVSQQVSTPNMYTRTRVLVNCKYTILYVCIHNCAIVSRTVRCIACIHESITNRKWNRKDDIQTHGGYWYRTPNLLVPIWCKAAQQTWFPDQFRTGFAWEFGRIGQDRTSSKLYFLVDFQLQSQLQNQFCSLINGSLSQNRSSLLSNVLGSFGEQCRSTTWYDNGSNTE